MFDLMKEEGMQHVVNTINAEHKISNACCHRLRISQKPFTEHEASDLTCI